LLLGCIDGSLVLFDEGRGITHLVKAAFVRFYSKVNTNLQRAWIIPVIRNFHNIYSYSYGLVLLGHNLMITDRVNLFVNLEDFRKYCTPFFASV